jgi:Family of unknown function (DUF6335)
MAKKSGKSKGQKVTPAKKRKGAGARAAARSGTGSKRAAKTGRKTGRKTAAARTSTGKKAARRGPASRPATRRTAAAKAGRASKSTARPKAKKTAAKRTAAKASTRTARRGGTGRERGLAQTPDAGRSVKGRTNPMPTRRSTGTAAGAGAVRRAPGLERDRKRLRELEERTAGAPSSLNFDRKASAARSGSEEMREARREHNEVSPDITAGDVDADWEDAYSVGDEAPGGDNPTPDQDRVDDIGKALGVQYEDNEELKAVDKISQRDRHRWELDPASSEDYTDRGRDKDRDEDE